MNRNNGNFILPEINTLKRLITLKSKTYNLSLYEVGWIGLYFLEAEEGFEEFWKSLKLQIQKIVKDEKELSEIAINREDIIGLLLSAYCLIKLNKIDIKIWKNLLEKFILKTLKNYKWLEYDGELFYALFLLSSVLNFKMTLNSLFERAIKVHKDDIRTRIFYLIYLSSSSKNRDEIENMLKLLTTKESLQRIKRDIEISSLFILSLVNLLEKGFKEYKIDELIKNIFESALSEIKNSVGDLKMVDNIFDYLIQLKETGHLYIYDEDREIIRISGNLLIIDVNRLFIPFFRMDIIAKFLISAVRAGYDRPYLLSKKEKDVYQQIKNEIKHYRRIRKYELLILLFLFLLFEVIAIYSLIRFNVVVCILLFIFSSSILYTLYKKGEISSLEDIFKIFKDIFSLFK